MTSAAYSRPSKLLPGKMRLTSKMEPRKLGVGLVAGSCIALLTYVSVAKLFAIYSPVFASSANTSAALMPPPSSKPTTVPETEAIPFPEQPGGSLPEEDEAVITKRKETAAVLGQEPGMKPQMVIVSGAAGTRKLLNLDEVAAAASELGFNVTVAETEGVPAQQVNSADVLLAVHGAGLTADQVGFLPAKAVVMQIVPPWGEGEATASNLDGQAARDMELGYLEYNVGEEETQGWQDVSVNLTKFRPFLLQALDRLQE